MKLNLTIAELLQRAAELDSDTPLLDAQVLLCHALDCSRTYLYTWPEREVPPALAEAFNHLLERRKRGEPIAHLVGRREFWSLSLAVTPATLIPRPDTELLVEKVLELELPPQARVLDLGTGTGAIALALASERPSWRIAAVDAAADAVALARRNARELEFTHVDVLQSDWFAAVAGPFELIVSNPPYVAADDPHLNQGDVRYEPRGALAAGADGLDDLRYIVATAVAYLATPGWLVVEHGADQRSAVQALFRETGYDRVETFDDLGGLPRVTAGCWRED